MELQFYLFWSSSSLIICYLFYVLLLQRETFFLINRIYLLAAVCLSLILPLVDLPALIELPEIELNISNLAAIGNGKLAMIEDTTVNIFAIIYWIGVAVSGILLLVRLAGIKKQLQIPVKGAAFSFWKTKVIDNSLAEINVINEHENVHIKQLHTIDILLIEVVSIFFWFNPILYCYRRSFKFIHEYLADEHASAYAESKKQYAMLLFLQNFKSGPALTNTFHNVPALESRIKMLQRKKSSGYQLWKYALCAPLLVLIALLCAFKPTDLSAGSNHKLDTSAQFPGGFEAFKTFLTNTRKEISGAGGTTKISFVVETNGEITDARIVSSTDKTYDHEAIRLIKLSSKWKPAILNGKKVRSGYRLNLNFLPDNQTDK